ncbi:MAG: acyl carrier protein [Dysgonamonadaceae bacterium]|jgi:acyl carrier protein|nr:acyl carrier protein [Dysgonamonadaceae bacterium]
MEKKEILVALQAIFREVLDDENIVLSEETVSNDIEGWDSLTHIQIIVAIEQYFKIKFTSKEILSWKNIDEMLNSVYEKKA